MITNSDDFGFSLVSEQELKAHEEMLRQKVEEQSKIVEKTTTELQSKIDGLRSMVMVLLNNLAKDPDKTYVYWPDRSEKIQSFITKINTYLDS